MFAFLENLENISIIQVKNQKKVYLSNSGLFSKALYIDGVKIFDTKVSNFMFDGKIIIFSVWNSNTYIIDIENLVPQILIENYSFGSLRNSNSKIIVGNIDLGDTWLYNFIEKYFVKKLDEPPAIEVNNDLIFNTQTIIKLFSLLTGEYEWELDLGLESKTILQIYAVSGDILLVSYENPRYGLCGIDVHTGKVVWDIQPKGFSPHSAQIDEKKGILINISDWFSGLSEVVYFEINIQTGEYLRRGYIADIPSNVYQFVLQESFIYFIGGRKQVFPNVVGVLDYETLSVLWWEKIQANDALAQIQVSENKIYVLDGEGTLHIYERDETIPFEKPTKSGLLAFEYLPDLPAQNIDKQNFNETDDLPF